MSATRYPVLSFCLQLLLHSRMYSENDWGAFGLLFHFVWYPNLETRKLYFMAYTTQANVEAITGTLSAEQATYFSSVLLPGVEAFIDKETETSFGSSTVVQVFVSGTDGDFLIIPTMHDITAVHNMETDEAVSSSEYTLIPQGGDNKEAVYHKNAGWSDGIENYRITGEAGYKEVPADITLVATEMAASGLSSAGIHGYKSERVGDWAVTYADVTSYASPKLLSILRSYRRLARSI